MILTAYAHGLRASEVVQLTPDNLHDGFLHVRRLKGSLPTTHRVLGDKDELFDLAGALFDYAKKFAPNQRLFPITRERFWQIVQEHGKTAGLPKHLCHPHVMKHTICAELHEKIGTPNTRVFAGHKSGASTLEYGKPTEQQVMEAVRKARESQDQV